MKNLVLIVIFSLVGCAFTATFNHVEHARYGMWESFSPNKALSYPEFDIIFLGSRPNGFYQGSDTHRLADIFQFEIRKGETKISLSWCSGTGDIGPEAFTLNGKSYYLEMVGSPFLGWAKLDTDVAIWPKEDYEAKRKSW